MQMNCPNCGGPVNKGVCEYCGSVIKDDLGDKYNTKEHNLHNSYPETGCDTSNHKYAKLNYVGSNPRDAFDNIASANEMTRNLKSQITFWIFAILSFVTFGTPMGVFFAVMGYKKTRRKMFTKIIIIDIIVMLIIIALLVYKFFIK